MADEDAKMADTFSDDANWIEDRHARGSFHARRALGYFEGSASHHTWVPGLGTLTSAPPPPYRQGDAISTGANPGGLTVDHLSLSRTRRATPSVWITGAQSLATYSPPEEHEAALRHHALNSRDRFVDEPYWGSSSPSVHSNSSRHSNSDRDNLERDRLREHHRRTTSTATVVIRRGPRLQRHVRATARRGDEQPRRIVSSPDMRAAPFGRDGHPQSPWSVRVNAPDYDGSDDECASDPDYPIKENNRITKQRSKTLRVGNPPNVRPRGPHMGMLEHAQFATLPQARNLCGWLAEGSQEAWEAYGFVIQDLSARPLAFRTEGESYLLHHQQGIEHNWWVTTTGAPRPPRHRRSLLSGSRTPYFGTPTGRYRPATPCLRIRHRVYNEYGRVAPGPLAHRPYDHSDNAGSSGTADTLRPRPAWSFGTATPVVTGRPTHRLPQASRAPRTSPPLPAAPSPQLDAAGQLMAMPSTTGDRQGYLGTSPPDLTDPEPQERPNDFPLIVGLPNSRATESSGYVTCWDGALQVATRYTMATRWRITPPSHWLRLIDAAQSHQFRLWLDMFITMFSVPGMYARIVELGGYPLDSMPLAHYPRLTDNITMPQVAAYVASHGISPETPAVATIESFAISRRNAIAGNSQLDDTDWVGFPRSLADIAEIHIPAWLEVDTGPEPVAVSAPDSTDDSTLMEVVVPTSPPGEPGDNTVAVT
ncbi:hypothetical protein C8J57DRAFT_1516230 [Mycena rebaudengoi]|nr:hypothetical protein C8J57DRAFT_1516230 [Mycena rebaudengoi]